MAEETYSFEQARLRLEEIASQVKKKDTSLEKSLDLLEEGVRLANLCTEQIDHTQWKAAAEEATAKDAAPAAAAPSQEQPARDEQPAEPTPEDGAEPEAVGDDAVFYDQEADGAARETVECEPEPAGADAEGDIPSEDPPGGASEEPPAEDPDVEA